MFKSKLLKQEQGFTLIEVLVAILIATSFITVAMQIMAIAAVFKVRAQEFAEATNWIQEDLENVKYEATNFQYTSLKEAANSATTVLQLNSVDNFQPGDTVIVGTDSINNKIAPGGVDTTAKTITLTAPLGTNWLANSVVAVTTKCNPTSRDVNQGFADGLRDWITRNTDPVENFKSSKLFTNKKFRLLRTTTLSSDYPYAVLQLNYDVSPTSSFGGAVSGESVASFYTEVIPNAALQCPK